MEGRKSAHDFVQLLTLYKSRSKYKYTKPPADRTYKRHSLVDVMFTPGICSIQLSCIDRCAFKTVLYSFISAWQWYALPGVIRLLVCWLHDFDQRTGDEKKITTKYTMNPAIRIPP